MSENMLVENLSRGTSEMEDKLWLQTGIVLRSEKNQDIKCNRTHCKRHPAEEDRGCIIPV